MHCPQHVERAVPNPELYLFFMDVTISPIHVPIQEELLPEPGRGPQSLIHWLSPLTIEGAHAAAISKCS